jgi:hypothetical protein
MLKEALKADGLELPEEPPEKRARRQRLQAARERWGRGLMACRATLNGSPGCGGAPNGEVRGFLPRTAEEPLRELRARDRVR